MVNLESQVIKKHLLSLGIATILGCFLFWAMQHWPRVSASHTLHATHLSLGEIFVGWVWLYCLSMLGVFGRWDTITFRDVFGERLTLKACFYASLCGLAAGGIAHLSGIAQHAHFPWHWDLIVNHMTLTHQGVLMLGLALSPVLEELLYRGVVIGVLKSDITAPTLCLISAYLWALPAYEGPGWVLLFFLGFGYVLAGLRVYCKTVWAPLCAHLIFNAIFLSETFLNQQTWRSLLS